jgi:site-specific DNA recombinase
MKVVIWARVSSREQREGYSIDAQLRATRDRATKGGWSVVREFAVAESAKRGAERVAFNEMFKWVRANARKEGIKAILAHKLDRVCRNMRDAVRLQELEDDCGVQLAFVENQFGPGAAGALSFNVMAAVAQYYSDNLRSEVLKGMDEKIRQGWLPAHAPFGYMNVDDKNEPIQPHPEKAKALSAIFELYSLGTHNFATLANQLEKEGHTYRGSYPRFTRTTLSYILNNRFYIGELKRNGMVYLGKHRQVISRLLFEACQDIINGRVRRGCNTEALFSGGLIRCAHCGKAIIGEVINRRLIDGSTRLHVYYKCCNREPSPEHPKIRWREEDVEAAVLKDLVRLKMPSQEIADWFRATVTSAFTDLEDIQKRHKAMLAKRKTELTSMKERLLNCYLSGVIEETAFNAKNAEIARELLEVEESAARAENYDPEAPRRALGLFEFSQQAADLWARSSSEQKREILACFSSNAMLSTASLCLTKRKPFDFLVERPFLEVGRGDWTRTSDLLNPIQAL